MAPALQAGKTLVRIQEGRSYPASIDDWFLSATLIQWYVLVRVQPAGLKIYRHLSPRSDKALKE